MSMERRTTRSPRLGLTTAHARSRLARRSKPPRQAVTPGKSILKRRITNGTSGIEPETRRPPCHLPLVVYADVPWRLTRAIRDDVLCTSPGAGQSTAGCDTERSHITH